jgi:quercetin dioxygenase-like cupin family protein
VIDKNSQQPYYLSQVTGLPEFLDIAGSGSKPPGEGDSMKLFNLPEAAKFSADKPYRELLYDSPNVRILTFNFEPGQELPVHSHNADSEVALLILEGEGVFTGGPEEIPAQPGTLQIMSVTEPHGLRANTRLRLVVFIAPTL